MERIVNIADSHQKAKEYDILQQMKMKPQERQLIARELKKRFYELNSPDVRKSKYFKSE